MIIYDHRWHFEKITLHPYFAMSTTLIQEDELSMYRIFRLKRYMINQATKVIVDAPNYCVHHLEMLIEVHGVGCPYTYIEAQT